MGKKVLISEKPSVAMEFAKVLQVNGQRKNGYIEGQEWIITWCVGHLVTMSYPDKYDEKLKYWRLDTLPFIPQEWKYEVIPNVEAQFNVIKNILTREDVDTIYVSTDSGREGEYIYRLVDQMIGVKGKAKKRVWIDSQTEEEIKRGIQEAKDLSEYDSLSDSAYLRAKEDYLIGINFSRLLSVIYGKRVANQIKEEKVSISVGRVMTCVLGMVVEREREIRNFVKTPFYKIIAEIGNKEEETFKAEWKVNKDSQLWESPLLYNENGFKKLEEAKRFILSLQDKKATITEMKKAKQKENAPLLFNLAEIQNECTKRFKIKPDQTLEIIQNLYENKLVTYPRTDARVLSTAIAKVISKNLNGLAKGFAGVGDEEIQGYLKTMAEEKYKTNLTGTKYVNDSKITDHYAIIPTGQGFENYQKLSDLHKQVYRTIVKRFLAIFYPPAEYEKITITATIEHGVKNDKNKNMDNSNENGNEKIWKEQFNTSSKICIQKGYLAVLGKAEEKGEEKITEKSNNTTSNADFLKTLKKGQIYPVINFETKDSETSPPTRYSSGSIILAMENAGKLIEEEELREQIKGAGIGTSATRAEIIKKLEKINYLTINTKTQIITPTQKGEIIYDVVKISMPDMLNPKLTASWEKGLDMVAKKEIKENEFMKKLETYIHTKIDKLVIR